MAMDIGTLASLGEWMDAATQARQLPDPQRDVADIKNSNEASSALYIRALRSRLASLGYLEPAQAQGDTLTPELRVAIFSFQREAGFGLDDVDGWAGPRTKRKLQQLVSFEDEQDISQWGALGEDPASFSAVARAVYLRLYTLGCFPDWSQPLTPDTNFRLEDNPLVRKALQRFLDHAQALGLVAERLSPTLDTRTVALLFGHDALIRALGERPDFVGAAANQPFVAAIGRVELWLLGYDVAIACKPSDSAPDPTTLATIDAALADFLENKVPSGAAAGAGTRSFSTRFFRQAAALLDDQVDATDLALQDAVLKDAAARTTDIANRLSQLAGRVWDGLKRAWAWLKAAVKHAAQAVEDRLWNVARVVASGARSSYELVLKAVDVVHRGIVCLRCRLLDGSDPRQAMLAFGDDFGASLFVNQSADPHSTLMLVARDADEGRCFGIACRLLGLLVTALQQVIEVVTLTAGLGWFVLLVGLYRLRGSLREIDGELNGLKDFQLPSDSLYLNPVR